MIITCSFEIRVLLLELIYVLESVVELNCTISRSKNTVLEEVYMLLLTFIRILLSTLVSISILIFVFIIILIFFLMLVLAFKFKGCFNSVNIMLLIFEHPWNVFEVKSFLEQILECIFDLLDCLQLCVVLVASC